MTKREPGALARFAVEDKKVSNTTASPRLFDPMFNKEQGRLEVSVCRINGLRKKQIKREGFSVVQRRPDKDVLHGWAELSESDVRKLDLCVLDDTPPPRHAIIVGWPEKRQDNKRKAQDLAREVTNVKRFRPPRPVPENHRMTSL